jgi:hypothetical protein
MAKRVRGGPSVALVDASGNYLGRYVSFLDETGTPVFPSNMPAGTGVREVPLSPDRSTQKWNFATETWGPAPPEIQRADPEKLVDILVAKGVLSPQDAAAVRERTIGARQP